MTPWLAPFLETMRAEARASDNTILAYHRDISDFATALDARGKTLATATRQDIEAYLIALDGQGLAASTRARKLSAIRQIFRFAFEEKLRTDDPAIEIKGPKQGKSLPKTLRQDEVDRLLEAAVTTGRNPLDRLRNTALMQILYATGMRVSELVSLPMASVLGDPEMLLVKGKGGKERLVPLTTAARMAIKAYLTALEDERERRKQNQNPKFLFASRGKLGHMTRIRFYTLIKEIAVNAGISPQKVSPHVLRHAFATHLLANGADLRVIQMLLGHADVATTEIYTHVMDEKMRALVFEHHPLADG